MTFSDAIRTCFQKYATFSGRAARSEYWWFVLFYILASAVANLIDNAIFGFGDKMGLVSPIFALAMLLPMLGVAVRRMHDIGRSGWWVLIGLIPILGMLVLLYWYTRKGEDGTNDYGADPLARGY